MSLYRTYKVQRVISLRFLGLDVTEYRKLQAELELLRKRLETANEELQSTNEEFETTNEELQSTNEELQTINEELRQRTDEVNASNAFLECILSGLRLAVVMVDRNFRVLIWNPKAEDLWGLGSEKVTGESFLSLDTGLAVERLREPIRACLVRSEPQETIFGRR